MTREVHTVPSTLELTDRLLREARRECVLNGYPEVLELLQQTTGKITEMIQLRKAALITDAKKGTMDDMAHLLSITPCAVHARIKKCGLTTERLYEAQNNHMLLEQNRLIAGEIADIAECIAEFGIKISQPFPKIEIKPRQWKRAPIDYISLEDIDG